MARLIDQIPDDKTLKLPAAAGAPEQVHVLADDEIAAIEIALAARRALLVRGEPGTGKTQLALAAAVALKRAFVPFVVDSRTESRDLLWHYDAVARLAEAQVQGVVRGSIDGDKVLRDALAIENFIQPRPLWWAFDWAGAEEQRERAQRLTSASVPPDITGCDARNGVVVLIDEIDKAETDVPNGLLEALGAGEFAPHGMGKPVKATGVPPLVIITSNEERSLPDAFVRRCLVLQLRLPEARDELIAFLVERGKAHFEKLAREVLECAAGLLFEDREKAKQEHWLPYPGQAEFIDLLRAVDALAPGDAIAQEKALKQIKDFALRKHPGAIRLDPKDAKAFVNRGRVVP
jgi:MoxR-like ATPase